MERKYFFKLAPKAYAIFFFLVAAFSILLLSFKPGRDCLFPKTTDSYYYMRYAVYIADNGLSGFRELFRDYIANKDYWVFPSPLRAGYILISSLWLKVFGYTFIGLASLSLFSFLILLLLSFYFIKKYFGARLSLLCVLLIAFSPLNMAMARSALQDATANLFMTALIFLFFEIYEAPKSYKKVLFIALFSVALLIKESSVVLAPIFICFAAFKNITKHKKIGIREVLAINLVPLGIAAFLLSLAAGSFSRVIKTASIIITSPQANSFAIRFCSGPWFRPLIDFMLLSPWVCILSISFIPYYILSKGRRQIEGYLCLVFAGLILLFSFFAKNVRYLIVLDVPMRVFTVLILNDLANKVFKKNALRMLFYLVIIIALLDFLSFNQFFVKGGIYDPSTCYLLKLQNIIP